MEEQAGSVRPGGQAPAVSSSVASTIRVADSKAARRLMNQSIASPWPASVGSTTQRTNRRSRQGMRSAARSGRGSPDWLNRAEQSGLSTGQRSGRLLRDIRAVTATIYQARMATNWVRHRGEPWHLEDHCSAQAKQAYSARAACGTETAEVSATFERTSRPSRNERCGLGLSRRTSPGRELRRIVATLLLAGAAYVFFRSPLSPQLAEAVAGWYTDQVMPLPGMPTPTPS